MSAANPAIPAPAAEMRGVVKKFGNQPVVTGMDLTVPRGVIFGMIGPSGCGKTTIIRLLLGVLAPSAGDLRVLGSAPNEFTTRLRAKIGYTPQGFTLYPTLTVLENARFVGGLYGIGWWRRRKRVREVLKFLELWEARNRLARDISGGMQRRLSLACALLHHPDLLFVDEPTAGLDPMLRAKIWEHLRSLCNQGATVIVTTQYIDEAIYCDTVAVLHRGHVAAIGSPDELRQRVMGGDALDVELPSYTRENVVALWAVPDVRAIEPHGPNLLRVFVDDLARATPAVTRFFDNQGVPVTTIRPWTPGFDEVFMKIVEQDGGN